MSTTTWVSGINAAYGLATDGTYIYVSYSSLQEYTSSTYDISISSYKISDKSTSSYVVSANNNTLGPLTIDTTNNSITDYLYTSYYNESQLYISVVSYPPTMLSAGITYGFSSYYIDENQQSVNPNISAVVIAGNYLYASFYDGFLGRCILTDVPDEIPYSNDYYFGSTNNTYGLSGYNDLGTLTTNIPYGLARDTTYLYIACTSGSTGSIIRMTLSGAGPSSTGTALSISGGTLPSLTGLTISSDYVYLYALSSSASTITKIELTTSNNSGTILSTYSLSSSYAGKLRNGIVSNGDYLYAANYGTGGDQNNGSILRYGASDPTADVTCFGENTKILCFNATKLEEEYVSVKYIRPGTLVKTVMNSYVRVDMIGKSSIKSYANDDRIKNRLYKCTKENYPEIVGEDLILTGCHSILVDSLTEEQREKTIEEIEQVYVTDRKYRLFTFLDPRAEPYQVDGELPIYHIALENDNYYMNYGIYANGLLVESCSKRYLKELSGMTLIE